MLGQTVGDLAQSPPVKFAHPVQEEGFYNGALWGFLSYDPSVPAAEKMPAAPPLTFFQDSGFVYHRNPAQDITFAVRCGPWIGYHAYRHAPGPCDRMGTAPGAGHFMLARGHKHLLATPESGYRLRSILRSCLLVDGKGQYGDIGYPMSIPSWLDRGEEIQFAQPGWVRLNLAPAYPAELQMAHYTRDFFIHPDRLVCRDHVVFNEPHQLSWLFQGKEDNGVALGRFGDIAVEARPVGFELRASVQRTPVVWSYSSNAGFRPFAHLRYDTGSAQRAATVEFMFAW